MSKRSAAQSDVPWRAWFHRAQRLRQPHLYTGIQRAPGKTQLESVTAETGSNPRGVNGVIRVLAIAVSACDHFTRLSVETLKISRVVKGAGGGSVHDSHNAA